MITKIIPLSLLFSTFIFGANGLPLNAEPGQCFTKAFYPPKYTKSLRIKSTKKVLINEGSVKYDVIPPEYSTYEERIKINDGEEKLIVIPATYKKIFGRVLIEPEQKVWRKSLELNAPKAFNSCVQSALNSGMDIQNAEVGTCFYEHFQPTQYRTTTSKILVSQASEKIITTPAKYRTVFKTITTDNTKKKLIPSMAVYQKVKDKVVIAPPRTEWKKTICADKGCNQSEVICLTEIPTTYRSVTKKIVLQPAVMKKIQITPITKIIEAKELVEPPKKRIISIPAEYQAISKREISQEEHFYWTDLSGKDSSTRSSRECDKICLTLTPAKYKRVAKRVVDTPARTKKIVTPPQYTTVKIRKVIQKASFKKISIPKEYITVVVAREKTKGFAKWMPVVCESNMTPTLVKKIQKALHSLGYYQGVIDGTWNLELKSAGQAYQRDNNLNITRKFSIEAMKSLGIY